MCEAGVDGNLGKADGWIPEQGATLRSSFATLNTWSAWDASSALAAWMCDLSSAYAPGQCSVIDGCCAGRKPRSPFRFSDAVLTRAASCQGAVLRWTGCAESCTIHHSSPEYT